MKYLFAIGFLLAAFSLHAQAPYTGGEGDGYTSVALSLSDPTPTTFQFDIARTEVASETVFELRITGLESPGKVEAFDVSGRLVQQWTIDSSDAVTLAVQTAQWASGAYIFRLQTNGESHVRKVIHSRGGEN